jgi:hypothetical protein
MEQLLLHVWICLRQGWRVVSAAATVTRARRHSRGTHADACAPILTVLWCCVPGSSANSIQSTQTAYPGLSAAGLHCCAHENIELPP